MGSLSLSLLCRKSVTWNPSDFQLNQLPDIRFCPICLSVCPCLFVCLWMYVTVSVVSVLLRLISILIVFVYPECNPVHIASSNLNAKITCTAGKLYPKWANNYSCKPNQTQPKQTNPSQTNRNLWAKIKQISRRWSTNENQRQSAPHGAQFGYKWSESRNKILAQSACENLYVCA